MYALSDCLFKDRAGKFLVRNGQGGREGRRESWRERGRLRDGKRWKGVGRGETEKAGQREGDERGR